MSRILNILMIIQKCNDDIALKLSDSFNISSLFAEIGLETSYCAYCTKHVNVAREIKLNNTGCLENMIDIINTPIDEV